MKRKLDSINRLVRLYSIIGQISGYIECLLAKEEINHKQLILLIRMIERYNWNCTYEEDYFEIERTVEKVDDYLLYRAMNTQYEEITIVRLIGFLEGVLKKDDIKREDLSILSDFFVDTTLYVAPNDLISKEAFIPIDNTPDDLPF